MALCVKPESYNDDGAFVRNAECYAKYGFLKNVQSITKRPYVYRWPSGDHQLLYIQERVCDISEFDRNITHSGMLVTDVMQFYKGYNPAAQFESRQLKNGIYFCSQYPMFTLGNLV